MSAGGPCGLRLHEPPYHLWHYSIRCCLWYFSGESGAGVSASEEALASSSAPIGSWGSQVDLRDSERTTASECLRGDPIVSRPKLFSSSGEPSGSDGGVPSSSGDIVGHRAADPALYSSVNGIIVTDTVSGSERMGATGAIDYNASGAMHRSGDSINGNDTVSSNTVSNNSDNNVCVTVVDSGLLPPSGVADVTNCTENVISNVGRNKGASNAAGGGTVAAGGDPRPQPFSPSV